jgi:hypothetical protein
MGRTRKIDTPPPKRIDDYLRAFSSRNPAVGGSDTAGDASLEEYLLERAARELRAGGTARTLTKSDR